MRRAECLTEKDSKIAAIIDNKGFTTDSHCWKSMQLWAWVYPLAIKGISNWYIQSPGPDTEQVSHEYLILAMRSCSSGLFSPPHDHQKLQAPENRIGLGVELRVHFPFSVLGPCVTWVCPGPMHAVTISVSWRYLPCPVRTRLLLQGIRDIREASRRQSPKPASPAFWTTASFPAQSTLCDSVTNSS